MVCRALDPENASEVDWEALVSVSGGSVLFGVSFARGFGGNSNQYFQAFLNTYCQHEIVVKWKRARQFYFSLTHPGYIQWA